MSIKIISPRHRESYTRTVLNVYRIVDNEICFGFPVTNGEIVPLDQNGDVCEPNECVWWENYQHTLNNKELYSRVEEETQTWIEDAIAICHCGKEIPLRDKFYGTCECENCGRWYNLFGQECMPPDHQMQCEDW